MYSIESRFVIGPSNILFASVYVCTFQPGNVTDWGSEGVKASTTKFSSIDFLRWILLQHAFSVSTPASAFWPPVSPLWLGSSSVMLYVHRDHGDY